MPYELDLSMGGKFYNYEDAITNTGTSLTASDLSFNLDFHLLYPLRENLKFYFNFGIDYTTDQNCDPGIKEGFCVTTYSYQVPLAFIMKSGIKRTLFSSTFKKGFNLHLGIEREELSYSSASKNLDEDGILKNDGGKLIKPTKSTLLWLTYGLEYNFSIWNKQSSLFALGSYSLSGSTQTRGTSEETTYWEDIKGFKIFWGYKQHLTKSFWANFYSQILNFNGKFSFTSTHMGGNIGYSF